MIKRIIFVEDGTVDLDDLKDSLGDDTKVVVYRQGSNPPSVLELKEPARYAYEDEIEKNRMEKEISSLKAKIKTLTSLNNELEDGLSVAGGIICEKCGKENGDEGCVGCKLCDKDELIKIGREI